MDYLLCEIPENCKCLDGARTALSPTQGRIECPWQGPSRLVD